MGASRPDERIALAHAAWEAYDGGDHVIRLHILDDREAAVAAVSEHVRSD
jgi:hypothetical protein